MKMIVLLHPQGFTANGELASILSSCYVSANVCSAKELWMIKIWMLIKFRTFHPQFFASDVDFNKTFFVCVYLLAAQQYTSDDRACISRDQDN